MHRKQALELNQTSTPEVAGLPHVQHIVVFLNPTDSPKTSAGHKRETQTKHQAVSITESIIQCILDTKECLNSSKIKPTCS